MLTMKNKGRLAGFIYFLLVITGIFNLMYVPSQLIVMSDPAQTVSNIMANPLLLRAGMVTGILSYICYLLLPFVLFDLFKDVNRNCALLMVILSVISVPISIANMVNFADILTLLSGADYLSVFNEQQIQTQVMLKLKSYSNGIKVVQIFWGLWLLPLGYLVYITGYIPKILGVMLMLGCVGYLILFFKTLLFPEVVLPSFIKMPGSIGEIGTCLWLLIMGVNTEKYQSTKES